MTRLALGLGLTAALSGCDLWLGCTDVGCIDGVDLDIEAADRLDDGTYEVVITGDNGLTAACTATLDAAADPGLSVSCDDETVLISVLYAEPGPVALLVDAPNLGDEVTVGVSFDGAPILEETVPLTYQTVEPNGPRCGPTCEFASASLALP
ncbi:MAG: hypothetical protein AAF211_30905 [Myxococcota bacterium]